MSVLAQAFAEREKVAEREGVTTDDLIFVGVDVNRYGSKTYSWQNFRHYDFGGYEIIQPDLDCHFFARAEITSWDLFTNEEYMEAMLSVLVSVWNSNYQEKIAKDMFMVYTNGENIIHFILPNFQLDLFNILCFMRQVEVACFRTTKMLQQVKTSTVFDLSIYRPHCAVAMCNNERFRKKMKLCQGAFIPESLVIHPRTEKPAPTKMVSYIDEVQADMSNESKDSSNLDKFLREIEIFKYNRETMQDLLIAFKRAGIPDIHVNHLLRFRFSMRDLRSFQQFYESIVIDPSKYSLGPLLRLVPELVPLAQKPDLFDKALDFKTNEYALPDGRAKPVEVRNTDLFPHQAFLAISPMGSGKTYQQLKLVQDMMKSDKDTTVIVLSCRQLMAKDIERRYRETIPDIENYMTLKETAKNYTQAVRHINLAKRLIIQLESLHLIDTTPEMLKLRRKKLVMIVDEAETIFAQFISKTMERHYRTTWATFQALVSHATVVLFGEAVPSMRTYEFCQQLCPNLIIERNVAPRVIKDDGPVAQRVAKKYVSYAALLDTIARKCAAGKRCGIFCSTMSMVEKIYGILSPRFRVQKYHSKDRTGHGEFDNLHAAWGQYDIVIWTSVVTVGVSYDLDRFDFMAAFVSFAGPYIRDCIQAVHRIRNLTDNELLWASNGPIVGKKKLKWEFGGGNGSTEQEQDEQEPVEDEADMLSEDGSEESDSTPLVFFESDEVMTKVLDERNSKLDRTFADMVDAADPMIRRLVFYQFYETKLSSTNALAGLLFGYFLEKYVGYRLEDGRAEDANDEDPLTVVPNPFENILFRHGELPDETEFGSRLDRSMFTPNWEDVMSVVLTDTREETNEDGEKVKITKILYEQNIFDCKVDQMNEDRLTLEYRQQIKTIYHMLQWCYTHRFIDVTNTEFMGHVLEDFQREYRTWTFFPKIMAEDLNHDLALRNAGMEQRIRTQNERSLTSDTQLNYLRIRWELQSICNVRNTYEVGPTFPENDLKKQATRILACHEMMFGRKKHQYQAKNLRLIVQKMLKTLRIGVSLQVERVQKAGVSEYTCQWFPSDYAVMGAHMAIGQVVLRPTHDETLPVSLKRKELAPATNTQKKRGRPRKLRHEDVSVPVFPFKP